MRRLLTAAAIAMIVGHSSALAAPRFQCTGMSASGFVWLEGAWQPAIFDVSGYRYSVDEFDEPIIDLDGTAYTFTMTRLDSRATELLCAYYPSFGAISARLYCGDIRYGIVFDFDTLRYTAVYTPGFVDGDADGNTPSVELGTCVAAE